MRQTFDFSTDTGTAGDTGPIVRGLLRQLRWIADTGVTVTLTALPRIGDTGEGWDLWSEAVSHNDTLRDTGGTVGRTFLSTERLRCKVAAKSTAVIGGRMYVWLQPPGR